MSDDSTQDSTSTDDVPATSQDTTDTDSAIPSAIGKIENLPAYLCGTYTNAYSNSYTSEWFVLDESSFTYHTAEKDYVFTPSEYDIEVNQSETTIYITKDSASYLYFYYSRQATGFYINGMIQKLDGEDLENSIDIYAYQTDVLNFEPLDTYVNVDNDGKWGTIPYSTTLENILLDGMSDDYYIRYYPSSVYMTDSAGNSTELPMEDYQSGCFTEDGYMYNRNNYVYVFENEADAQTAYDYYMEYEYYAEYYTYKVDGCILSYYYTEYASPDAEVYSEYNTTKIKNAYNTTLVCGVHCTTYYDTIYYMSKPIMKDEIAGQIALSDAMAGMETNGTIYSDDGNYAIYVYANGFFPDIDLSLYNESIYLYCYDVSLVNGIVVCKYTYDYEDISYYSEITMQDRTLTAVIKKFDGVDSVSFDTYSSMTPVKEYTFSATIPESTY